MERILIGSESEILVGRGFPEPLLPGSPQRVAVLVQPGAVPVADRVRAALGGVDLVIVELPDREEAKRLETVAGIYRELARGNVGRHDVIVGVGGGAATDVAGFVAATWLRGVDAVLVPTTLLGAVDAAIGGKTGINVPVERTDGTIAKNLVGAFHHPRRVIVDLDVLDALDPELRREGSAEVLKAGLLADRTIVDEYAAHGIDAPLERVVPAAIRVKAAIVEEDFTERGRRVLLNLGHTIGHAVEGITGMSHGHAVAVGMVAAGRVSAMRYAFDEGWLVGLLAGLGLPVEAPGLSASEAKELVLRDKKRTAAGLRMVLLRDVADPVVEQVGDAEVDAALTAIGAR